MFDWFLIEKSVNNLENFAEEKNDNKNLTHLFVKYCMLLLKILTIVVAVYLAFECNVNSNFGAKVLLPVFAFFYPIVYLIWYFIYRKMLGNSC